MLTEFDLHLFGEGTLHRAFEKLGAHRREVDGRTGVHFAVWAPNAEQVSVIGDFNGWNARSHPMRNLGVSGIWETFVPKVGDGERYKYEIRSRVDGARLQKADPYGFFFESDASGAAIVWDLSRYTWRDQRMDGRAAATERLARSPVVGLRVAPRIVEARAGARRRPADLSRDGRADRPVREGHGLHAHRAAAGARASVRRLVGISGDRFLRADEPLRPAGRFQGVRRRVPRQRHRRHSRLGARAFSEGCARSRAVRRHRALRARGSAPGRAPRLGHAGVQLRPPRGARVSAEQRAVLAGGVSHRRSAR